MAVKGYETVHSHTHNYMDWYWSGGTGSGTNSGSGGGDSTTNELLTMYSVNEAASGSGSMSVTSAPASGGYNTFSDIISGGGPTSLNEAATNEFYLSGGANAGSSGTTSTFSLQSNGTENLNLSTSVVWQRTGSNGSSGSNGNTGTAGSGSDSSYLNDAATDTFSYSGGGGNGPSGPTNGTFSLTSSGSDSSTSGVSGGGSTSSGATDMYSAQDTHRAVFLSTDSGSSGPSPTDTLTDNTISADTIISSGSGTTTRTGGANGAGSDYYQFGETTTIDKGVFASNPNNDIYDTMTSGSNSSGSFGSGTLTDSGSDSTTMTVWGSGSGTIVDYLTSGSSSAGTPLSDSYYETDNRQRGYVLDVGSGSMYTHDWGSESASGSSSIGSGSGALTSTLTELDSTDIVAQLSSSGALLVQPHGDRLARGGRLLGFRDGEQRDDHQQPILVVRHFGHERLRGLHLPDP